MAFTITISTTAQVVNNDLDTLQLILTFDSSGAGSDEVYTALEKGIRVQDWGEGKWKYDFEDALLVPGTISMELADADHYLDDLLFGSTNILVAKKFHIELKLNGETEYLGDAQEDSIDSDLGTQVLKFTADPNTAILNKTLLYDDDLAPLNPLGVTIATRYPILSQILLAYQLVDPTIAYPANLEISHDWLFKGVRFDPADAHPLEDMTFQELEGLSTYFFFDSTYGLTTVADFLKKLALGFCAFTGLIHAKRAFFKKLFYYDAANVQTLGVVQNRHHGYRYGLLDYVEVKTQASGSHTYSVGTDNHIEGRTLKLLSIPECRADFNSDLWAIIARSTSDDGEYNVYTVKDPVLLAGAFSDLGDLQVALWGNFRMNMANCRVDHITTTGIVYDFLKNFPDDGKKYQPISLTKHYADNLSEFEAIYLGEV